MYWQFMWFVLAGFVLGFTLSTLWEWFHFRRERMIVTDRRIADLEAELRSYESRGTDMGGGEDPIPVWVPPVYDTANIFPEPETVEPAVDYITTGQGTPTQFPAGEQDPTTFSDAIMPPESHVEQVPEIAGTVIATENHADSAELQADKSVQPSQASIGEPSSIVSPDDAEKSVTAVDESEPQQGGTAGVDVIVRTPTIAPSTCPVDHEKGEDTDASGNADRTVRVVISGEHHVRKTTAKADDQIEHSDGPAIAGQEVRSIAETTAVSTPSATATANEDPEFKRRLATIAAAMAVARRREQPVDRSESESAPSRVDVEPGDDPPHGDDSEHGQIAGTDGETDVQTIVEINDQSAEEDGPSLPRSPWDEDDGVFPTVDEITQAVSNRTSNAELASDRESVSVARRAELAELAAQTRAWSSPVPVVDESLDSSCSGAVRATSMDSQAIPVKQPASRVEQPLVNGYPDNLSKIKGIGKVYRRRLYAAGIYTWHQVANTTVDELRRIVQPPVSADVQEWPPRAQTLAEEHGRVGAKYAGPMPDDLMAIRGIGPFAMSKLFEAGICTYQELAALLPDILAAIIPTSPNGNEIDYGRWIRDAAGYAEDQER